MGIVYIVGAGPGDPGLLTLKAKKCIEEADVIIYDRLVDTSILNYKKNTAELIYAGKEKGTHIKTQEEINKLLLEKAGQVEIVVRLKGGDPFVFGRGGEEAEALAEKQIAFEVVPGVTSGVAAAAYAGIPITHRKMASSVTFVTGHEDPEKEMSSINWAVLSTSSDTLVFYMALTNLEKIIAKLISNGRIANTPAAVIEWGTTPRQRTAKGSLDDIAKIVEVQGLKSPALFVVGDVVNLRDSLSWFEQKTLYDKKILVTRPAGQEMEMVEMISASGGQTIHLPLIRIEKKQDLESLDNALLKLSGYEWIVFTSVNGVKIFFKGLWSKGLDARSLNKCKIAAIGPATARALESYGIRADKVPETYVSEGLIEVFSDDEISRKAVLLVRAEGGREVLPVRLRELGAVVDEVLIYRAVDAVENKESLQDLLDNNGIDIVTLTSPSGVRSFISMLGRDKLNKYIGKITFACIGPVTAQAAREAGLLPLIEATEYTSKGLVQALVNYLGSQESGASNQNI